MRGMRGRRRSTSGGNTQVEKEETEEEEEEEETEEKEEKEEEEKEEEEKEEEEETEEKEEEMKIFHLNFQWGFVLWGSALSSSSDASFMWVLWGRR